MQALHEGDFVVDLDGNEYMILVKVYDDPQRPNFRVLNWEGGAIMDLEYYGCVSFSGKDPIEGKDTWRCQEDKKYYRLLKENHKVA